jgi:ADP-ribosylglycohydrolase
MITRIDLIKNKKLCADRAMGALIGHAIGDSFGDAARSQENHFLYGITMDFDERASWSTDDTDFALLTAQTLIAAKGNFMEKHVLNSWKTHVATQNVLNRGGASEREAAANIRRGLLPPDSGRYNSHYLSDGAAMRVTPIGIVCAGDPQRAARYAEMEAQVSHWRDGIWGAQAVAAAVAVAMVGGAVDEIIAAALECAPEDSWFRHTLTKALCVIDSSPSLEEAWMPLHSELWTEYKAAAPEAVTEALAVFKLTDGDFRKGIIYGGNFGRDADTIAAIVGAISGARCGLNAIPEKWVEKVRYSTGTCLAFTKGMDILKIGKQLAQLIK